MKSVAFRGVCSLLLAGAAQPAVALHDWSRDDGAGEGGLPLSQKRAPVKETWPWYHSADEIHDRLSQLSGNCAGADFELSQSTELNSAGAAGTTVSLDVVRISRSGGRQPKTKAMLIYGEHAREIISPESALNFIETLCGTGPSAKRASEVLDNVSFTIVPNANPISRKVVEDGYYCKRTNEDGVDLNRNFGDAHRVSQGDIPGEEMNPGPRGFSEPESRIVKALVDEERPDTYVSVHSGAYLLGMPFGYSADARTENDANMLEVLRPISEKYCEGNCPYGNLAKLINYENPGCDIDYVAEQVGSPYVFTWEIYVGEDFRQRYTDEARMQREQRGTAGGLAQKSHDAAFSFAQEGSSRLRGRSSKMATRSKMSMEMGAESPEAKELVDSCIEQFNPKSEEETKSVVAKWTDAYLDLAQAVDAKQQQKAAQAAAPASSSSASAPSLSLAAAEASLSDWPDFKA